MLGSAHPILRLQLFVFFFSFLYTISSSNKYKGINFILSVGGLPGSGKYQNLNQ